MDIIHSTKITLRAVGNHKVFVKEMNNELNVKLKERRLKKVTRLKEENLKWQEVKHAEKVCFPVTLKALERKNKRNP